jgi:hypothetical protein
MNKTIVINPSEILKGDPQKISANIKKFNKAEAMVKLAVKALEPFKKITSVEDQQKALEVAKQANTVSKAIEDRRKVLVKPFNDSVTAINTFAKGLCMQLDGSITVAKTAILAFQKVEEERVLKLRTDARIAMLTQLGFEIKDGAYRMENIGVVTDAEVRNYDDRLFKGLVDGFSESIKRQTEKVTVPEEEEDELFAAFGSTDEVDLPDPVAVAVAPAPVYNAAAFATSSVKGTTKRWTYEVTDISRVPREYLAIDSAAIRAAIASGNRSIAGIRIYQDESLSLR